MSAGFRVCESARLRDLGTASFLGKRTLQKGFENLNIWQIHFEHPPACASRAGFQDFEHIEHLDGGSAGLRVCGSAGLRVCGMAGQRDGGLAGLRDCGTAGWRDGELAGRRVFGFS